MTLELKDIYDQLKKKQSKITFKKDSEANSRNNPIGRNFTASSMRQPELQQNVADKIANLVKYMSKFKHNFLNRECLMFEITNNIKDIEKNTDEIPRFGSEENTKSFLYTRIQELQKLNEIGRAHV